MERAVFKKGTIQLKYQKSETGNSLSNSSKSKDQDSTAQIHKQINTLRNTFNQITQNTK